LAKLKIAGNLSERARCFRAYTEGQFYSTTGQWSNVETPAELTDIPSIAMLFA
jgi:hypothetical protein